MVEELNLKSLSKLGGASMSAMHRYRILDEYTLTELKRRYQMADAQGRIELLQNLLRGKTVPYQIELMAVQDHEVQVRQWIARHGSNLRYSWHFHRTENGWVNEDVNPTLYDQLNNDPDPFVRACLRENPRAISLSAEDEFRGATQIERLALMRNPDLHRSHAQDLLEKIFNHEDRALEIESKEREDLILAFLTNSDALKQMEEKAGLSGHSNEVTRYKYDVESANSFLNCLWELAAKWPTDNLPAPVPYLVYAHLPASDKTKAKIYEQCSQPIFRESILEHCSKQDVETFKLGVKDENENCRDSAKYRVDDFGLYDVVYAPRELDETELPPKTFRERLLLWRTRIEEILSAGFLLSLIAFSVYGLLFTVEGNKLFEKLLELYNSTLLVKILFWFFVILVGLIGVGIIHTTFEVILNRYRWFYHFFWLGLIGGFYFFAEDKTLSGIFAAFYGASVYLPKLWEELSNELVNKIVTRLEVSNKQTSPLERA